MKKGNGRISTTKKKLRTAEDGERILKKAKEKTKEEYLESICNEIIHFQRRGSYALMEAYMKRKELGWKDTQRIQNTGIEDSLKGI